MDFRRARDSFRALDFPPFSPPFCRASVVGVSGSGIGSRGSAPVRLPQPRPRSAPAGYLIPPAVDNRRGAWG